MQKARANVERLLSENPRFRNDDIALILAYCGGELIDKLVDALMAVDKYIGNPTPTDSDGEIAKQALDAYNEAMKQIENEIQKTRVSALQPNN